MNELIMLAIKASIFLLVFSLGLGAHLEERRWLLHRPKQVARSLFAMNVAMPLVAALLAAAFNLHPAVKIALVALAVSPVPPFLPGKEMKAGGTAEYALGLFVWASLLSIVLVPLSMALLGSAFGLQVRVPPLSVAKVVLTSVLLPLGAGMLVRRFARGFAQRVEKPLSKIAMLLLVVAVVPLLVASLPTMAGLWRSGTLAVIVLMSACGHALGHVLGGPDDSNRTVLAMSTASRHPGVAIAIAHTAFPEMKSAIVAVLLILLVNALVSAAYLAWRRRGAAGPRPDHRWRRRSHAPIAH